MPSVGCLFLFQDPAEMVYADILSEITLEIFQSRFSHTSQFLRGHTLHFQDVVSE